MEEFCVECSEMAYDEEDFTELAVLYYFGWIATGISYFSLGCQEIWVNYPSIRTWEGGIKQFKDLFP